MCAEHGTGWVVRGLGEALAVDVERFDESEENFRHIVVDRDVQRALGRRIPSSRSRFHNEQQYQQ